MLSLISSYAAIIASIWIVVGVYVAGRFYPNYSHRKQFCSELGATGSPTEKLSPLINNYPLGILFCLFGLHVLAFDDASILINLVAWLVIVHGIGTWVAGYFPMDADPYIKTPTVSCNIHSWAGFIMLLSLLIAPLLVVFSESVSVIFRWFSAVSAGFTIYFLVLLAKAFKARKHAGVYQRVSYGIQLLWLSAFSWVI